MKKLEVKKVPVIADGVHSGKIVGLDERETPHHYLDVTLSVDNVQDAVLRVSYPIGYLSENTYLGRLLDRFGAKLTVGSMIDPAEFLLINKAVRFRKTTVISPKDQNEYAEVLRDSLRPLEKEELIE